LLWANLHASVGIGLLAIALYCVQRFVSDFFSSSRDRHALLWTLLTPPIAFAAACINPEGIRLPLSFRVVSDVWVGTIREWLPLASSQLTAALQIAGAATALSTVAAIALTRRTVWWLAAQVGVMVALTITYRRFLPFALFASVPLLAANIGLIKAQLGERAQRWQAPGALLASAALLWMVADVGLSESGAQKLGIGIDEEHPSYPISACDWVRSVGRPGRMINDYNLGSYLMYCLGKEYPLLIDQRAWSLYSDDFWQQVLMAERSPADMEKLLADYPASWAMVPYNTRFGVFLASNPGWRLVYFDDKVMVLRQQSDLGALESFDLLNPLRLYLLPELKSSYVGAARAELARQEQRCPDCYRTELARAAIAIAGRNANAASDAIDRLLERGETPELALLVGRLMLMRGNGPAAIPFFWRYRELGGDPRHAKDLAARAGAGRAHQIDR
jgi:hypothetical protein